MTHNTSTINKNDDNALCLRQIDPIVGKATPISANPGVLFALQTHSSSFMVLNANDKLADEKIMNNKSNKINLILLIGYLNPNGLRVYSS